MSTRQIPLSDYFQKFTYDGHIRQNGIFFKKQAIRSKNRVKSNRHSIKESASTRMLMKTKISQKAKNLMSKAVQNNDVGSICQLIDDGFPVDLANELEMGSVLLFFSAFDSCDSVNMLIDHGADVNFRKNEGDTPLICAINNSKFETAKVLLDALACPNKPGRMKHSPLYQVLSRPSLDKKTSVLVDQLLTNGADLHDFEMTQGIDPLMLATKYSSIKSIDALLLHGYMDRVDGSEEKISLCIAHAKSALQEHRLKKLVVYRDVFLAHKAIADVMAKLTSSPP